MLLKICASFHCHLWIQTGVTVQKLPIWVEIEFFVPCDVEIWWMTFFYATLSFVHHFIAIGEFRLKFRVRKSPIWPQLSVSRPLLQFEFTDAFEIHVMQKAWHNIEEVPYRFSGSSVKFEVHMGPKNAGLDPNWAFPDFNSSLNSLMLLK